MQAKSIEHPVCNDKNLINSIYIYIYANEFFDLNSEESIRKVANGEFARWKRKYAYRATFKLERKFCNESESLNLQESYAGISMGNQCRINIIRVPR